MRILVLNGPNLNLLGQRDPARYGEKGMDGILEGLRGHFPEHGIEEFRSNHEGDLIDALHRADREFDGVVLNGGGYTHSSIALGDAVEAIRVPVIEVHISNILGREAFRHRSYIAPHAKGSIMGLGEDVYRLAVDHLLKLKDS
ncbi:MAG: type II 3-dehydroquinate dehydratase [Flavobacteriales bacterium]